MISDLPLHKQPNGSQVWGFVPAVLALMGWGRTATNSKLTWNSERDPVYNKTTDVGPVSLFYWTGRTWRPRGQGSCWLSRSSGPTGRLAFITFDQIFLTFYFSNELVTFLRRNSKVKVCFGLDIKGSRSIVARKENRQWHGTLVI